MIATAEANPVTMDPTGGLGRGLVFAAITFALAIEVAVTSAAVIWLCRIEVRPPVVAALALLNLASYFLFIRLLHPFIGKILITESLIWVVEAAAIFVVSHLMSEKPLSMKRALVVSLVGNLASFLVGYGV